MTQEREEALKKLTDACSHESTRRVDYGNGSFVLCNNCEQLVESPHLEKWQKAGYFL